MVGGDKNKKVHLRIEEIKQPELNARLVAESIAEQIGRRVAYRRAAKQAVQRAERLGAKGVRVRLAGRLGGEEFAIFLYDTNRANALSRAEDLREAIKALDLPGNVRVTTSIGVATATPLDAVMMEAMVGQADVALYRAKHDQRDCVREWADGKSKPSLQLVGTNNG